MFKSKPNRFVKATSLAAVKRDVATTEPQGWDGALRFFF